MRNERDLEFLVSLFLKDPEITVKFSTPNLFRPVKFVHLPILLMICFLQLSSVSADDWQFSDVSRIVAVSDIHGAYDAAIATLQQADVIGGDLPGVVAKRTWLSRVTFWIVGRNRER